MRIIAVAAASNETMQSTVWKIDHFTIICKEIHEIDLQ